MILRAAASTNVKRKNNHLTQGQRLKRLNLMIIIYKKVIFFLPAETPVL